MSYVNISPPVLKIVVLGATGQTGQCVVTQALEAGHDVTAVVRNPAKMTTVHERLKVVEGDIFSENSLQDHMTGQDVVLSCIGHVHKTKRELLMLRFTTITMYTDHIKPLIAAMSAAKVKRLINITSWGTSDGETPFMLGWIIKPLLFKTAFANAAAMERYIEQECPPADIRYTVVRPPILGGVEVTDQEIRTEVGRQSVPGNGYSVLNRGDLARFMMKCLHDEDGTWDNKMVAIGI